MAGKPIYLEPDEEITSVIDKISQASDKDIILVLSKNSGLFQSLVNLKLLTKEAKRLGKNVSLVSANKVGVRLAKQVGIATYATIAGVPAIGLASAPSVPSTPDEVINGVKVQQYDPNRQHQGLAGAEENPEAVAPAEEQEVVVDEPASRPVPTTQAGESFEPVTIKPEEIAKEPETDKKEFPDLPPVISRSGGFSVHKEFKMPWRSVAIGAGVFLIICLMAFIFVPRAVITVTFPAHPLTETVAVSAVAELASQTAATIPGNKVTAEKTKTETITATGKKDVGTKAGGTITITNRYRDGSGVGKDQSFAAGTEATDANTKKVFLLNNAVTIGKVTYDPNNGQPIYKSQSVGVTAVAPGEAYNIAASSFTVEGALADTPATSASAFSGGLTKVVTILSQDDVDTVILKLKQAAKEEALAELADKSKNQKLLADGIWETVKQEGTDKAVGTETASANAIVAIEYGTIAFDESTAKALFTESFNSKINESEEIFFPEDNPPVFVTKLIAIDRSKIDFEISGTAYKVPKIDKAKLAKSITNDSKTAATALLQDQYGAETVDVKVSPTWWIDRLPLFGWAIKVEYGFTEPSAVTETSESTETPAP